MDKRRCVNKKIIGITMFMLVLSFCVTVRASETDSWKTVRVSCGINRALYLDDEGNPVGYCAAYLENLADRNQWKLEYVEGSTNESIQNLMNGKVDIVFPLQQTEKRKETMAFSTLSGGYQPLCLYALDGSEVLYNDYSAFRESRIAVTKGSSNEQALSVFAQKHHFSYTPVYIESQKEKSEAVKSGRADFIAASTVYDVENYMIVAVMKYEPFYYAVKKENTELFEQMNSGMEQIMIEQPDVAMEVGLNFLDNGAHIARTREEYEWIQSGRKIVVGVYQDTPPMYHKKEGEEAHGIYVDLLQFLEQKTGIKIEIYPISRDLYAYDLLKAGTIDVVLGSNDASLKAMSDTSYRLSAPILNYTTVTISRHDYLQDDDNPPVYILTAARQYWESMILKDTPNAVIKYCRTASWSGPIRQNRNFFPE